MSKLKRLKISDSGLTRMTHGRFVGLPDSVRIDIDGEIGLISPFAFKEDPETPEKRDLPEHCYPNEAEDAEEGYRLRLYKKRYTKLPASKEIAEIQATRFHRLMVCITDGIVKKLYSGDKVHDEPAIINRDLGKQEQVIAASKITADSVFLFNPVGKLQRWARSTGKNSNYRGATTTDNNCTPVKITVDNVIVLENRRIKGFASNWYQVERNNFFRVLKLQNNQITEITPELLNGLPRHIETVYLNRNKIKRIKNNVINNTYIADLNLANNEISNIEDGAFKNLPNLQDLNLNNNRLTNMNFVNAINQNLRKLYISSNRISKLPSAGITAVRKVEILKLDNNNIDDLKNNTFSSLRYLKLLQLDNNDINTIEDSTFNGVQCLEALNLAGNSLTKISNKMFKNLLSLKALRLNRNNLSSLEKGSFKDLYRLSLLDLSENKISKLDHGVFYGVSMRSVFLNLDGCMIELTGNRIKSINSGIFSKN